MTNDNHSAAGRSQDPSEFLLPPAEVTSSFYERHTMASSFYGFLPIRRSCTALIAPCSPGIICPIFNLSSHTHRLPCASLLIPLPLTSWPWRRRTTASICHDGRRRIGLIHRTLIHFNNRPMLWLQTSDEAFLGQITPSFVRISLWLTSFSLET